MSLIRYTTLFNIKSARAVNLLSQSMAQFSSGKKAPSKDSEETESSGRETKKKKSLDDGNQLHQLLSRLTSRARAPSALDIIDKVKTSKPLGYKQLRQVRNLDANDSSSPRLKNVADVTKAVSKELGDEKVAEDLEVNLGISTKESSKSLDDILASMKVHARRPKREPASAGERQMQKPRHTFRTPLEPMISRPETNNLKSIELFDEKPLGIFTKKDEMQDEEKDSCIWTKLEKHELRLRTNLAPRNYFEKMAFWTEEGKVWHFPIDNEQGLDMEHQTSFAEHVFLEEHLEPWCPKKGAVRNFMELICIGLSKNPYLSVQQKREHIEWYRDYFDEKRDVLQRVIEEHQSQQAPQIGEGPSKS